MSKKNFIITWFLLLTFSASSQTRGITFSFAYDSLASLKQPTRSTLNLRLLNSSFGFNIGGFYNKTLGDRFLLGSKFFYNYKGYKRSIDESHEAFHYVGIDESLQYRLRHKGNLFATLGIGGSYRLPFKSTYVNSPNSFDTYGSFGLRYVLKKFAITAQYHSSFTNFYQKDLGNTRFNFRHRVVQIGVEIPIK